MTRKDSVLGATIDKRYEVLEKLNEGGYATIYKARHINMGKVVALKILRDIGRQNAEEVRQRFIAEAQIICQLNHPSIVTVYDLGFSWELGRPYIIMELLEGHDAHTEVQLNGPFSPDRLFPLLLDVLCGLTEAHDQGVVHKDLKPSNLFLLHPGTPQERLMILDFGVARHALKTSNLTSVGQFVGTSQYLAPEYILRQEVSPVLDVYQIGLVLIELLTGHPVVDFDDIGQCLLAHCSGNLRLPSIVMDGPFGDCIARSLVLDPNQRYADARALRTVLAERWEHFQNERTLWRDDPVFGARVFAHTPDTSMNSDAEHASLDLYNSPFSTNRPPVPDEEDVEPHPSPLQKQPLSTSGNQGAQSSVQRYRAPSSEHETTHLHASSQPHSAQRIHAPTPSASNHSARNRDSEPILDYDVCFKKAMQATIQRDYVKAIAYFEACLRQREDDLRVLHNLKRIQRLLHTS